MVSNAARPKSTQSSTRNPEPAEWCQQMCSKPEMAPLHALYSLVHTATVLVHAMGVVPGNANMPLHHDPHSLLDKVWTVNKAPKAQADNPCCELIGFTLRAQRHANVGVSLGDKPTPQKRQEPQKHVTLRPETYPTAHNCTEQQSKRRRSSFNNQEETPVVHCQHTVYKPSLAPCWAGQRPIACCQAVTRKCFNDVATPK